jgi:hypothetical protein
MRIARRVGTAVAAAFLFASVLSAARAQESPGAEAGAPQEQERARGWPRVVQQGDVTLTIYTPQVDKFEGDEFESRAAVQVETKVAGEEKPKTTYGVVWIHARTEIDKEAGLVTLDEIEVTKASFPGDPEREADYLEMTRGLVARQKTISLARIEANLAIVQAEKKGNAVPLKNDPPRIIYSTSPVLLVLVDGDPVLRPVEGAGLRRVLNTRALILFDGSRYYMPIMERWIQTSSLEKDWSFGTPPPAAVAIRKSIAEDESQGQADLLTDPSDAVKALVERGSLPRVVVSTVPAELILTRGKPQMAPLSGTQLLYVTNAESDIFLHTGNQDYYVPLSGRWYRARSLNGPWTFVDGSDLPGDFARISPNGPKASVLETIPGTPQAEEAVIANSIPQTAEVNRDEAKFEASYDGSPDFQPIPDTPLQYAANSPTPVIRVDAGTYYAVQEGVWFVGSAPVGPWAVATSVPTVIYTIPTASPIHYVTYVRVYRYTPTIVYVGYTPGYLGTCYSPWGTVVYGTGWYYRPWIGSAWLGYPWTWGFGAHFGWSARAGWSFGFGWGGYRPPWRPWWGPYGYGWGRHPRSHGYWARPRPGYPPRPAHYNFNNYNVYGGRPGVVRPAVRPAPRPAVPPSARPARPSTRPAPQPVPGTRPSRPTTRPAVQPSAPSTRPAPQPGAPATRPAPRPSTRPDIYAGRDGNVYRPAKDGSWQQYTGKDWKPMPGAGGSGASARPAPAPQPSRQVESASSLSRERQARQIGDYRATSPPPRAAPPRPAPKGSPPRSPR